MIKIKKQILALVCLILTIPLAKGISISPSSINITIEQDNVQYFNFSLLNLSGNTCSPSITPNNILTIFGLPSFNNASGNLEINALAYAPSNLNTGNYQVTISYCGANFTLNANVISSQSSQQTQSQTQENCPNNLYIFGSKIPGKTIAFDIRDSNFNPVKGDGVSIFLTSSEGDSESVQCPVGYCTWKIPDNWRDSILYQVIAPNCTALTGSFDLKMAGSLQISVPSRIAFGEDFYIYVFDPTKGKITGATVEIIDPMGRPFRGRTDEGGIVKDEVLVKTYGIDIKPDKIGTYKVYASMFGYNSANSTFEIYRLECPYECCELGKYEEKLCPKGYKCENNSCVKIIKPKVNITCEPEEVSLGEEIECKLLNENGEIIKTTVPAKIRFKGEEANTNFVDGVLVYSFNEPGTFKIEVDDFGEYEGNSFKGEVLAPKIPIVTILLFLGAFVLLVVIIYIIAKRGFRIFRKKEKIHWETQPETSFPVEEE